MPLAFKLYSGDVVQGDFSRYPFQSNDTFTGVLLQQGRGLVDAEWNAQCAYANEQLRTSIQELISRLGHDKFAAVYKIVERDSEKFVGVDPGVYFVQGVRIQLESKLEARVSMQEMPLVSLHVWETTQEVEPDPALDGADSRLRSKLSVELQFDPPQSNSTSYLDYVNGQRGRIQLSLEPVREIQDVPKLFRVEVLEDSAAGAPPKLSIHENNQSVARKLYTPSSNSPELGMWLHLTPSLRLTFDRTRRFRRSEYWSIPYRGANTGKLIPIGAWLLPSGQHYFAEVRGPATNEWNPDSGLFGQPIDERYPATPNTWPTFRMLAASALLQAQSLILKKWLGTALILELDYETFDVFWQQLQTQLPMVAKFDNKIRKEAEQIWNRFKDMKDRISQQNSQLNVCST